MAMETLHEPFIHELRDLLSAERQLLKALPKMAEAACSEELRASFEEHLEQTEVHVSRLEQTLQSLGETVRAKTCRAMQGLMLEGEDVIEEDMDADVKDATLIAAAQKAEHYEIAAYGTLVTWARQLGRNDIANLLAQTLDEEKQADQKLSDLAESGINAGAAG